MGVRISTAFAGATILLAACGGGGGGGSVGMSDSGPGSSDPSGLAPDTIVLGGVLVSAQGQLFRLAESCDGTVCTVVFQGETAVIDLRDVHPDNPEVTITGQQTRNGVQIGRATASGGKLGYDTLGVWGNYNVGTPLRGSTTLQGMDVQFAFPMSHGTGSGSNPLTGSVTWTGAMAGVKVESSSLGAEVIGDADMTVDLGASSLELEFTNIAERISGAPSNDIHWQGVSMQSGSFQAAGLDGRFYGPNHEEAGGVFEHSGIAGAFSLARQ